MKTRRTELEPEVMDDAGVDPLALRSALNFIRRINRLLGYNRATVAAVRGLGGRTLLDVACGSADLAEYFPQCAYVGLDFHETTLGIAREWTRSDLATKPEFVRGNALRLPFADDAFDVCVCGMFLHHLEEAAAVEVIRELDRVSRRGWVVADLVRRQRALAWITLFTLFADPAVKHDARTSVRQAWTPEEARGLVRKADVRAVYRRAFGHRFLLVGDKRDR